MGEIFYDFLTEEAKSHFTDRRLLHDVVGGQESDLVTRLNLIANLKNIYLSECEVFFGVRKVDSSEITYDIRTL